MPMQEPPNPPEQPRELGFLDALYQEPPSVHLQAEVELATAAATALEVIRAAAARAAEVGESPNVYYRHTVAYLGWARESVQGTRAASSIFPIAWNNDAFLPETDAMREEREQYERRRRHWYWRLWWGVQCWWDISGGLIARYIEAFTDEMQAVWAPFPDKEVWPVRLAWRWQRASFRLRERVRLALT